MLVTSAAEVMDPCIFNFLQVCLNNGLRLSDLAGCEASGCRQVDNWGEPELGLSIWMCDMDMDARFFSGEEEQPEGAITYNGRCHPPTLADSSTTSKQSAQNSRRFNWTRMSLGKYRNTIKLKAFSTSCPHPTIDPLTAAAVHDAKSLCNIAQGDKR